MSVYIIALPRTGSSTLMNAYSKQGTYTFYAEPWNPHLLDKHKRTFDLNEITPNSNVILKTMSFHKPDDYEGPAFSWHIEAAKNFNTVIVLDRFSTEEQAESLYKAESTGTYHMKYLLEKKEIDKQSKLINEKISWLNDQRAHLEAIALSLDQRIVYYEDLYYPNDVNFRNQTLYSWGLTKPEALKMFDISKKYRQPDLEKTLL